MFVMGDQNKMFGSLYDESDDRDAPVGSFKTLTNFVHSKTRSALQSRGGLVKDIDNFQAYLPTAPWVTFPSQCHATKGNLSVHKVINGIKFRLKSYPGIDFTLMSVVCRYDQNIATGSATDYAYVLKFFIYPFIPMDANMSGASIATPDPTYEWRDITPYYVDMNFSNGSPNWVNTSGSIYELSLASAGITIYPFNGDVNVSSHVYSTIANKSIYCYSGGSAFTAGSLDHKGEGFRFTGGVVLSKSVSKMYVNGNPCSRASTGRILLRSNTLFGAMSYNAFLMDSSDIPTVDYEFLPDGNLVISVNSLTLNSMFELTFLNNHYLNKQDSQTKQGSLYSELYNNKTVATDHYIADQRLCYGHSAFDFGHLGLGSVYPTSTFTFKHYASGLMAAATKTANITNKSALTIDPIYGTLKFANALWSGGIPADGALTSGAPYVVTEMIYGVHVCGLYCTVFSMHGRVNSFLEGSQDVYRASYFCANLNSPSGVFLGFAEATGNGVTKPADEALFTNDTIIQIGIAKHSGYRNAMHSELVSTITTPATYVLGLLMTLPATFDKRITDVSVVMSDDKAAESDFKSTDSVGWKVVVSKNIINNNVDQWDMLLLGVASSYTVMFCNKVVVGKNYYVNADIGGNHLLQTGNPIIQDII